jgi:hypothetical protein
VEEFLEKHDLMVHMPVFLQKGAKQHTTEDAMASRLLTKSDGLSNV